MNLAQTELLNASNHVFSNVALGEVCFISDLHLTDRMPLTLAHFEQFCATIAPQYDTLIILGDLFEYWLGDDTYNQNPAALRVIAALQKLRAQGKRIGFVVGNRDFLIRQTFAERAGMTMLPDPCILKIQQQSVVLSHGDLLCTDDVGYQRFRRFVHKPWVQNLFLKTPQSWRNTLANHLRNQSQKRWSQANSAERQLLTRIQDVNPDAVASWFEYTQAHILIHGHTHRPSTHLTYNTIRLVLPDWDCEDTSQIRWGYVSWSRDLTQPELNYFTSLTL